MEVISCVKVKISYLNVRVYACSCVEVISCVNLELYMLMYEFKHVVMWRLYVLILVIDLFVNNVDAF